eukprot:Opistho-1_new@48258
MADAQPPSARTAASVCHRCRERVVEQRVLQAMGREWHQACFRCTDCASALDKYYYERDGSPYCEGCFLLRFGKRCHGCGQYITGPIMAAQDRLYHTECFVCVACGKMLDVGELFALRSTGVHCASCAQASPSPSSPLPPRDPPVRQTSRTAAEADGTKRVAIVRPPTGGLLGMYIREGNGAERVSGIFVSRLLPGSRADSCGDVSVGDEIVEVNGASTAGRSLDEVTAMLKSAAGDLVLRVRPCASASTPVSSGACTPSIELPGDTAVGVRSSADAESASRPESLLDSGDEADLAASPPQMHRRLSSRIFRLADLEVGERIGKGFYGEVFKVTHRHTGSVMVLKELKSYDKGARVSFLKEVSLLKTLLHPNILEFIGVFVRDRKLHLITEYIEGGTLRKLLKNPAADLPWSLRVRFSHDIARGMAYLHSMRVIHRDLKSKNCLVRSNMSLVVADFGLARSVSDRAQRMTVAGSPYWMAPEMLRGEEYDAKIDVFSYGIVLCEIIGRMKADPDEMPRTPEFGLDVDKFRRHPSCAGCPESLMHLAIDCCAISPPERPEFTTIVRRIEGMRRATGDT